jgi:hypothetical protein
LAEVGVSIAPWNPARFSVNANSVLPSYLYVISDLKSTCSQNGSFDVLRYPGEAGLFTIHCGITIRFKCVVSSEHGCPSPSTSWSEWRVYSLPLRFTIFLLPTVLGNCPKGIGPKFLKGHSSTLRFGPTSKRAYEKVSRMQPKNRKRVSDQYT